MLADLRQRFGRFIDVSSHLFDPIFVMATAMDPRYKCILSDEQREAAKRQLISDVSAIFSNIFCAA